MSGDEHVRELMRGAFNLGYAAGVKNAFGLPLAVEPMPPAALPDGVVSLDERRAQGPKRPRRPRPSRWGELDA